MRYPIQMESLECILPDPCEGSFILGIPKVESSPLQLWDSSIRSKAKRHHTSLQIIFSELETNRFRTNSTKMSRRVSHFLSCLLLATLYLEGTNGFQTNPRSSISVVSRSRLSVATNPDSVSASVGGSSGNGVDYQAYGNGYKTVFTETPYANCEPSVGTIPSDLRGSYFRSGPGKKEKGDTTIFLCTINFHLTLSSLSPVCLATISS